MALLEKVRKYFQTKPEPRRIYGADAPPIVTDSVKRVAEINKRKQAEEKKKKIN